MQTPSSAPTSFPVSGASSVKSWEVTRYLGMQTGKVAALIALMVGGENLIQDGSLMGAPETEAQVDPAEEIPSEFDLGEQKTVLETR